MIKLLIVFMMVAPLWVFAQPDYIFRQNSEYKILQLKEGGWSISEEINYESVVKEEKAAGFFNTAVSEPFYVSNMRVKAKVNGSSVDDDQIYSRSANQSDVFLSDDKVHQIYFTEKQTKKGSVLSWKVSRNYSHPVYFPSIRVPEKDSVNDFSVTFQHPESLRVEFNVTLTGDSIKWQVFREQGKTTLKIKPYAGLKTERVHYPFNDLRARIWTRLIWKEKPLNGYTPEAFTNWYLSSLKGDMGLDSLSKKITDSLVAGAKTNSEKAERLFKYVKFGIRYIADASGGHSLVPHQPKLVVKKKYGDCKDRAFLISAMSSYLGLPVYPVLVSTDPVPETDVVHISCFNHVINVLKTDSGLVYFDPTSKYSDFGHVSPNLVNGRALILDPNKPEIARIPFSAGRRKLKITISANENSLAKAAGEVRFEEGYLPMIRNVKTDKTSLDLKNLINELITSQIQNISVSDVHQDSTGSGDSVFKFSADLTRFIIKSPTKMYIPKIPFLLFKGSIMDRVSDSQSLFVNIPQELTLNLDLKLSKMTQANPEFLLESENTRFWSQVSQNGDQFSFTSQWKTGSYLFEGNEKSNYLMFIRDWLKNKNQLFTLTGVQ